MKSIKILIPLHVLPNAKSAQTLFFENLLPVLKTRVNVHILWLVYTPEKINIANLNSQNSTVLDIHDYRNAVDVMTREKPDLIYAHESWVFIDQSLSSAANFFGIPVFCMTFSDIVATRSFTTFISSNINRFFQSSIPTDTEQNKKKFMKRGRFYLYKYLFLLKTKFALKRDILQTLFTMWKFVLTDTTDLRFGNNVIQFLENESLLNKRIQIGYEKSNLVVTGNPMYDAFFWKQNTEKPSIKNNKKIRVLFAPSTLYEHGFWTKNQRDCAVQEVVKKIIENNKEMSLVVKIHPSTSILLEYQSIIHAIDISIPIYQEGSIDEFLENTDVVITFQSSTAEVYALLSKIPIIIYNPFDLIGDVFLERNLAIECKESSILIQSIHQALSNHISEKNRDQFIHDFMYKWDGRSAERICDKIMELI